MVNVKEFIKRVGIPNHGELAKMLGIKRGTVDSWSAGDRNPTYEMGEKLLKLGMSVEELYGYPYPSTAGAAESDFNRKASFVMRKLIENIDKL